MPQSRPAIQLRLEEFDRITTARGWDTDAKRCRELDISQTTLSLLRSGGQNVGSRVIHRIMSRLEAPYLALFEEIPNEQEVA
jgi:hypothetical protein